MAQQDVEAVMNALVTDDQLFSQLLQTIQAAVDAAQVTDFSDEDRTALWRLIADTSETDGWRNRWVLYWEQEPPGGE